MKLNNSFNKKLKPPAKILCQRFTQILKIRPDNENFLRFLNEFVKLIPDVICSDHTFGISSKQWLGFFIQLRNFTILEEVAESVIFKVSQFLSYIIEAQLKKIRRGEKGTTNDLLAKISMLSQIFPSEYSQSIKVQAVALFTYRNPAESNSPDFCDKLFRDIFTQLQKTDAIINEKDLIYYYHIKKLWANNEELREIFKNSSSRPAIHKFYNALEEHIDVRRIKEKFDPFKEHSNGAEQNSEKPVDIFDCESMNIISIDWLKDLQPNTENLNTLIDLTESDVDSEIEIEWPLQPPVIEIEDEPPGPSENSLQSSLRSDRKKIGIIERVDYITALNTEKSKTLFERRSSFCDFSRARAIQRKRRHTYALDHHKSFRNLSIPLNRITSEEILKFKRKRLKLSYFIKKYDVKSKTPVRQTGTKKSASNVQNVKKTEVAKKRASNGESSKTKAVKKSPRQTKKKDQDAKGNSARDISILEEVSGKERQQNVHNGMIAVRKSSRISLKKQKKLS